MLWPPESTKHSPHLNLQYCPVHGLHHPVLLQMNREPYGGEAQTLLWGPNT